VGTCNEDVAELPIGNSHAANNHTCTVRTLSFWNYLYGRIQALLVQLNVWFRRPHARHKKDEESCKEEFE